MVQPEIQTDERVSVKSGIQEDKEVRISGGKPIDIQAQTQPRLERAARQSTGRSLADVLVGLQGSGWK